MSKIIDSHCHPQFPQYDADRKEMLDRATKIGMICVGTDFEMSRKGVALAQQYENMWAAIGTHPNHDEPFNIDMYRELSKQPKIVAFGEIGLDYYRTEGDEAFQKQKELFIEQLKLAHELHLPIILHCRDGKAGSTGRAYPDMIEILKQQPHHGGVMHSCTASFDEAKQFLDLGFYLGFNGIITFARTYDDLIRMAPLDRILLETDAPYLTPEPYRGQRNEPAHVIEVAKKLAELKNEPLEKVIEQTAQNCENLFKIALK